MPPFVVLALPRCRTKWLSTFLQYGDWQVGHEQLRYCRSLADVTGWLSQPNTGSVETAAAPFWRLLPSGTRVVTVHRPVPEVLASLRRGGLQFEDADMLPALEHAEAKLRQVERRWPDVLAVRFADLADEHVCASVFEHCLPYRHDPEWWSAWSGLNVQISIPFLMRYFLAHGPQIAKLRAQAKHRILADMRKPVTMDGVTFQQEPFGTFLADGRAMLGDHFIAIGESPDYWRTCNLPLFQSLDDGGSLHVWTARSNGRMFGYLMTVLAPSFDSPNETNAEQIGFFADAGWPGLGQKLQRTSIADLKARGIKCLSMTATAPRLDLLYRRLGAARRADMYAMELN